MITDKKPVGRPAVAKVSDIVPIVPVIETETVYTPDKTPNVIENETWLIDAENADISALDIVAFQVWSDIRTCGREISVRVLTHNDEWLPSISNFVIDRFQIAEYIKSKMFPSSNVTRYYRA